jgi:hypothetical protein
LFPEDEHHPKAKCEQDREAWHLWLDACPEPQCSEPGFCKGLKDWRKCFLQGIGADPTTPDK